MSKRFGVQLGRTVREVLCVLVEIPDDKDEAWLQEHLSDVYAEADEDEHNSAWEGDPHWGCEESDSHAIVADIRDNVVATVKPIRIGFEDADGELQTYTVQVTEIQHVPVTYTVLAKNMDEAWAKAEIGETESEIQGASTAVSREVQAVHLQAPEPTLVVSAEALETHLLLVDVEMPLELLQTWPQEWLNKASAWAVAEHLKANDNDDVEIPPCPFYVWPDNTDMRQVDTVQKDLTKWNCVLINSSAQRTVFLRDWSTETLARRFAYFYFAKELGDDGSMWYLQKAE